MSNSKKNSLILDLDAAAITFNRHTDNRGIANCFTEDERLAYALGCSHVEYEYSGVDSRYTDLTNENLKLKRQIDDLKTFIKCNIIGNSQRFIDSIK